MLRGPRKGGRARFAQRPEDAARNRTCLLFPADQTGDVLRTRRLAIHLGRHEVAVDGELTEELTSTEFRVLVCLARKPGWVFTRQQILDAVHGDNYAITDRAVDVQIVGLRKKLGSAGESIQTVRGVGYRFRE